MKKYYCVTYGNNIKPYYGYIKPWNGVRDSETWSLTYCPPSMFDGIKEYLNVEGDIIGYKLTFDKSGMWKELDKRIVYDKYENTHTIHIRHCLVNPQLTIAFSDRESAEEAIKQTIYFGQNIYVLFPFNEIKEYSKEEFDNLPGVETIECDENDMDFYCGNNRHKNNKRTFVKIKRNDW